MSFSIHVPDSPVDDLGERIEKAIADQGLQLHLTPDAEESLKAAKDAALALVASGVVGRGMVSCTISGHANPGHVPTEGWANDCLTVALYDCTPA